MHCVPNVQCVFGVPNTQCVYSVPIMQCISKQPPLLFYLGACLLERPIDLINVVFDQNSALKKQKTAGEEEKWEKGYRQQSIQ